MFLENPQKRAQLFGWPWSRSYKVKKAFIDYEENNYCLEQYYQYMF